MPPTADNRTAATIIRQWQTIEQIKAKLVRQGVLNGDASPQQVLDALRNIVPSELFAK